MFHSHLSARFFSLVGMSIVTFSIVASCIGHQRGDETKQMRGVAQAPEQISEEDLYSSTVQKVFDQRCIACHSCLESPCQLNLQSHDGLARGSKNEEVYSGSRLKHVAPTRLYEDAESTAEWRDRGFHDVVGTKGAKFSTLAQVLNMAKGERLRPWQTVKESRLCASQEVKPRDFEKRTELSMPYGFPSLSEPESTAIQSWIDAGAPAPKPKADVSDNAAVRAQVAQWHEFLNKRDMKSKLVSRYLYEHLHLAHLHFDEAPGEYLKLIRSSQSCENPKLIRTRSANDNPWVNEVYYCMVRNMATVVEKSHVPYRLSDAKLQWMKTNFFGAEWTARRLPGYSTEIATNPFKTFEDIPVEARYRFLLEDSQYHVMTFVKGPVCIGSVAVNAIQEQFYVFFMDPKFDLMVRSPDFALTAKGPIDLPAEYGTNIKVGPITFKRLYGHMINSRAKLRRLRHKYLKETSPQGLPLEAIWNGNDVNDNAVLTVLRHDDNASVMKGAVGDISKTAFVLDYATFESLVYNLVVNFDIYGNMMHQALTRVHMSSIRLDSENTFLSFLPPLKRQELRKYWSRGFLTEIKMDVWNEFELTEIPNKIAYTNDEGSMNELVRKILFERMNARVRGPADYINWKGLRMEVPRDPVEAALSKVASIPAIVRPFSNFMPELSLLTVLKNGAPTRVYSIIRNRQHLNVDWFLAEGSRLVPYEDSLTIRQGILGAYPNQIFAVNEGDAGEMVTRLEGIKSKEDYEKFVKQYGIDRMNPEFWTYYDFIGAEFKRLEPVKSGALDLSRYRL